MTREEAKKAAEVMLAYANGEKIEQYYNYEHKWLEVMSRGCDFNWLQNRYRIKSKEKFDPKTLKSFDKVVVRNGTGDWKCGLLSHIQDSVSKYKYSCIGSEYVYCIPYNEDTKHLVGTKEEAPEFYRYWED